MKNIFKTLILLFIVFVSGVAIVGFLYSKDKGVNYFSSFLQSENAKKNVLEERLKENITTRVVVQEENAVIDVIEKSKPAIVSIVSETVGVDPFRGVFQGDQGVGTGFLVEDGFVFTNRHVVDNDQITYSVVLNDGKTKYTVIEVNKDPLNDFAILRIDTSTDDDVDLPTLELGDSENLRVGQTVIAIGNALGQFGNTASKGIVSGTGRTVFASSGYGSTEMLDNIIQTDAALNPGNSGGPLLDLDGKVVGINVARVVDGDNIGFSIPVESIKSVYLSFKEVGEIQRPYLGIQYTLNTTEKSALNRVPIGAVITEVLPNTPAKNAGLQKFDVIMQVDEQPIDGNNPLSRVIAKKRVGDTVVLLIDRDGKEAEINLVLEAAK
jgi:serine protease Do